MIAVKIVFDVLNTESIFKLRNKVFGVWFITVNFKAYCTAFEKIYFVITSYSTLRKHTVCTVLRRSYFEAKVRYTTHKSGL